MAKRPKLSSSPEVPSEILPKYKAITALIDAFCKRHLNQEYADMCRRLTLALAQKQPSPLARGSEKVWACGIVRTIGWANMLDDPKGSPYMKLINIDPEFGVANSTGQGKCMAIKRMFGIGRLNPDWTLPSRLGDNPVVWKVWVNDRLVDIRQESREQQEKEYSKGLIPWIPADREEGKAEDQPSLASVEGDLFGPLFDMHQRISALLRQSSLDEEELNLLSERIKVVIENMTDAMRRSRDLNLTKRLESAYEEIRRYAAELSSKEGSEEAGK